MAEMTPDLLDELASEALNLKVAVGAFRNVFFETLTVGQRDGLQSLASTLGDETDHLTAIAIKWSLADLQQSLAHLRAVTKGVKDAVAHLGDVRKVLTVAASLVTLGAAIASGDPAGVLAALSSTNAAIHD